jgi:2'-5' RNA ligase
MEPEKIEHRIAVLVYLPDEITSVIKHIKEETQTSYPNHETQTAHITIYSCRFNETKLDELVRRITNLNLRTFSVKLGKVGFVELNKGSKNLFASLGFEDETALRELHKAIWPIANELRGTLVREKDIGRFKSGVYSQELFSFIEKYGYEHVKENFRPHITLGEVGSNDVQKIGLLQKLTESLNGKEFVVNKIHILFSTRIIPSEKKIKESEVIEISLEG